MFLLAMSGLLVPVTFVTAQQIGILPVTARRRESAKQQLNRFLEGKDLDWGEYDRVHVNSN